MNKLIFLPCCLLSAAAISATPVYQPIGSAFTLSSAPNQRALSTSLSNPAAPYLMINQQEDDSFRFGILGPVSIGVEMGDVSDLVDQTDKLEDLVDASYSSVASAQVALDQANAIINDIGETAYVKTSLGMQIPFMPVIYKTSDKGAFMLDASLSAVALGNVLSDEIRIVGTDLTTDSSFIARTATDLQVGFGYSQSVWENSNGMLVAGAKANVHQLSVGRAVASLSDDSSEVSDAISDSLSDDAVSSSGVGIDIGAVWVSNNYQVGITLANINEPEFDNALFNTSCLSESCAAAARLIASGMLKETDKYIMEMQTTADFAVSTEDKKVTLGVSYDVNDVKDVVGDDYQWAAMSVSYFGDSNIIPGIRGGYRKNMAGTELDYASFGVTLFKRFNVDLAVALDKVKDEDGDEIPRGGFLALSYDSAF